MNLGTQMSVAAAYVVSNEKERGIAVNDPETPAPANPAEQVLLVEGTEKEQEQKMRWSERLSQLASSLLRLGSGDDRPKSS